MARPRHRAAGDCGELSGTLSGKGATGTVETIIAQGMDDIEQSLLRGTIYYNSYDLDLGYDKRPEYDKKPEKDAQLIGLRFQKLRIPPNAMITNAYIEFTVAEADASSGASYGISAHAVDNAPPFYSDRFSLQSLPRTGGKWNAAAHGWATAANWRLKTIAGDRASCRMQRQCNGVCPDEPPATDRSWQTAKAPPNE